MSRGKTPSFLLLSPLYFMSCRKPPSRAAFDISGFCRIIVRYGKTVPPPLVEISGSNSGKSTIFGGLADLWSLVVESDSIRQLSELGFCGRNFLRSEYGPLKEADLRFRTTEYRRFARIRGSFSNKGAGNYKKSSLGRCWRVIDRLMRLPIRKRFCLIFSAACYYENAYGSSSF